MSTIDIRDRFEMLGQQSSGVPSHEMDQVKPVTLRLDARFLCKVDALAGSVGMTRQALLSELVVSGFKEAEIGFLTGCSTELGYEYENRRDMCLAMLEGEI